MTLLFPRLAALATALVSSALLAGCAAPRHDHGQHQGAMMDATAMCEMHKSMMAGKTPQERQAMMDEHMKSTSPEMRQRMQAMHAQCG